MDQDPIQVNRQTYDKIAGQFAEQTARMDNQLIERASRLVEQIQPGARILDLGCGPGRDLGWFIENGIHALGIDLSIGMLMEARRVTGPILCQMEMRQLAFSSESFSGIWCNAALLHIPKNQVPQTLAEIYRVLVPGGHFFLSIKKAAEKGWRPAQKEMSYASLPDMECRRWLNS